MLDRPLTSRPALSLERFGGGGRGGQGGRSVTLLYPVPFLFSNGARTMCGRPGHGTWISKHLVSKVRHTRYIMLLSSHLGSAGKPLGLGCGLCLALYTLLPSIYAACTVQAVLCEVYLGDLVLSALAAGRSTDGRGRGRVEHKGALSADMRVR